MSLTLTIFVNEFYAFVFYYLSSLVSSLAATVTTNRSVMHVLPHEKCDIDILDTGGTISDFIDDKIKERSSVDNDKPFCLANLDSILMRHLRWLANLPRVKPSTQ